MRHKWSVFVAGALSAVGLPVVWLLAESGTVLTKDGKEYTGEITQSGESIRIVEPNGIVRRVPRDRVLSITTRPGVDVVYRDRVARLRDDDVEGHYQLAEWAREQERYDLVYREALKVLNIDPRHENAMLLARLAVRKIGERRDATSQTRPAAREAAAAPLLSEADIQKLRWAEFREEWPPEEVRVEFERGFLERFVEEYKADRFFADPQRQRFFLKQMPAGLKLQTIIRMAGGAEAAQRRYQDQVRILGDPFVFSEFKRVVSPYLLRNCGSAQCHGGPNPPAYRVVTERAMTPATLYTNFFLLDSHRTAGGLLLDRDRPDESLLLQYGLPPDQAVVSHPRTTTPIRPVFRGPGDPQYRAIRAWITLLRIPHPDYGIGAAGEPAAQGASGR